MSNISQFTDDEQAGIGIGPEHGITQARLNEIIGEANRFVMAVCDDLPVQTADAEVYGSLDGSASKQFVPCEVFIKVKSASGTIDKDGTINIGTTSDGAEILSAQVLTDLDVAGEIRRVPLAEATYDAILGNATIYANVQAADGQATTLYLTVYVIGRQI